MADRINERAAVSKEDDVSSEELKLPVLELDISKLPRPVRIRFVRMMQSVLRSGREVGRVRNTINWKQQAIDCVNKCRDQIKTYIENGIDRETALNMVLNESTIGAGFKAQIRYEFK